MYKKTKAYASIRNKLMAAVAMLLVASIMMVSTSYAWFTLSTAPEVTGITTTVGANGSLEIALSPTSGNSEEITSGTSDSIKTTTDWTETNITWGNLVDVSESYGLEQLVLNLAALNEDDDTFADYYLQYPEYGYDGRVSQLSTSGIMTAIYDSDEKAFVGAESTEYGVRAVGTASGMSEREVALKTAKTTLNSSLNSAKSNMVTVLGTSGDALASMMVTHASAGDDDSNDYADYVEDIAAVVTGMQTTVGYMKAVVEAAAQAYVLSTESGMDDAAAIAAAEAITYDTIAAEASTYGVDDIVDAISALETTITSVSTNVANIDTLGTVSWSDISSVVSPLINTDGVTVNGYAYSDVKENIGSLLSGIQVQLNEGSGALYDIAALVGNYQSSVKISATYNSITVSDLDATIVTQYSGTAALVTVKATVTAYSAPTSSDTDAIITDYYGYVIDLFVRTNASGSNLLLQTDAENRIYAGSDNEETMGNGASMTFAAYDTSTTQDMIENLMSAMRVVFFNTTDGTIYAYAKLDPDSITVDADGNVTMALRLYETTTTYSYTLTATAGGTGENYSEQTEVPTDTEDYKVSNVVKTTTTDFVEDQIITALTANTATPISVLVYIDGNYVDNGDVANAAQSMTGTLNLQFSSDAALEPMTYTPLSGSDSSATETTAATTGD